MLKAILVLFIALWLLGFIHISLLESALFSIGGYPVTLRNILLLGVIIYLLRFLPGFFQVFAIILLLLWLLSTFGLFFIGGLGNIILLILIIAVLFSLF